MIQERENFEKEKSLILSQVKEFSQKSSMEIQKWARLYEETTRDLSSQIARLHEENRRLKAGNVKINVTSNPPKR